MIFLFKIICINLNILTYLTTRSGIITATHAKWNNYKLL
jgi:hypothetical protein